MDKKAIAERLRVLSLDNKSRSKAARFRDVVNDIEAALAAGVTRSLVIKELAAHGLEMTLATFETNLRRIRQHKKKSLITPVASVNPLLSQPTTEAETEPQSRTKNSHDPAERNKICANKPDLLALAKLAKSTKIKRS